MDWWTDDRCPAVKTDPYRNPIQCTRDRDHDGPHYCAYTRTAWAED